MPAPLATRWLARGLLHAMALTFRLRPALREQLRGRDGWMDLTVGVRTRDGAVQAAIAFKGGRARVLGVIPPGVDTVLEFRDASVVRRILSLTPEEVMGLLLRSDLSIRGNLASMSRFNYLLSALLQGTHRRLRAKRREAARRAGEGDGPVAGPGEGVAGVRPAAELLRASRCDGVEWLGEPFLSEWTLEHFPRLRAFREAHFTTRAVICPERARNLTEWCRANGFETDAQGRPWDPVKRQAQVLRHLLAVKKPLIRKGDLLAGSTTAQEVGVQLYPETHATMIWGELLSVPERELNPYDISEETRQALHRDVFPYWEARNVREVVRREQGEPLCQRLDERFAVYFLWKTVAVSHTIADFPRLLQLGTRGLREELATELASTPGDATGKRTQLEAMQLVLLGLEEYARHLAERAAEEALAETDPTRRAELEELARINRRVPLEPAGSVHEALQAIWTTWVALHQESTNAGLSLGRMDQWLQPFLSAELAAAPDRDASREVVRRALELVGCFFLRCTDHLPLVPDLGNFLFGGSSSDQAITLGGTRPDGGDAVTDMSFVFLKVTEMLGLRDPNVNARVAPGLTSDAWLRRLCEVNLLTRATPSLHNDAAVLASLAPLGYPVEHARDWAATGCVEPTLSGRHMGHTNCMMLSLVAALEMALRDGRHPLMDWVVGPRSGDPARGDFRTFEEFFGAFEAQLRFLAGQACQYNNLLGQAHGRLRPTPLLSALMEGPRTTGRDVSRGGATHNSSGAACIGLADVVDSLLAVKRLVFDRHAVEFPRLLAALDADFAGDPLLHARCTNQAPKFGSGDQEALGMARRVAALVSAVFAEQPHYRGGRYTAGFWSMSNHVAFGCLAGALPSGRRAGKPFTPGLTPEPCASPHLLDPIRDVARLDPASMPNNMAFNVKVVPSPEESHAQAVGHLFDYARTYFDLGGMQMQLNVVDSATLRHAMSHPGQHRDLMVRISGYNAYFVTLNRELQEELVERAEYRG
jgi:formate C-acetyltransferase